MRCFYHVLQVDSDVEDEEDVKELFEGNKEAIEGVFKKMDLDGDGQITYAEFDEVESDK